MREHILNEIERCRRGMPMARRRALASRLSRALVSLEPVPSASESLCLKAIPPLLGLLLGVGRAFAGDLPILGVAPVSMAFDRVHISRGCFSGPSFDCSQVAFISEPVESCLQRKLGARYTTKHPCELVVYYGLQPVIRPERWLPAIQALIRRKLPLTSFRRCWVVDLRSRRVILRVWLR